MDINIASANLDKIEKLEVYVRNLFGQLSEYHRKIVAIDVYLNIENKNPGTQRHVGARVYITGLDFYAEANGQEDFFSLVSDVYHKIKRQLVDFYDEQKKDFQTKLYKTV